jgi:hypothetical protein
MNEPRRQVSEQRKQLYYVGGAIQLVGLAIFLSSFLTGILAPIGHAAFTAFGLQAFGGFFLILVGTAIRNVGLKGMAGSGVIIDPEKARQDVEPWSRMAGGMVDDALSEVKVLNPPGGNETPLVKIRCRACHALNEEDAKFCNQCGAAL